MQLLMTSSIIGQTEARILSEPGTLTWCVVLIDSEMEVLLRKVEGGEWYIVLGSGMQGKGFSGASCMLHSYFDTQVVLKKTCSFSSLEKHIWPLLTRVEISGQWCRPAENFLARNSVSIVKVDR